MVSDARKSELVATYGTQGCLTKDSPTMAIYAQLVGNDELTQDEMIWLHGDKTWCITEQPTVRLSRGRFIEAVTGDTVRIVPCQSEACLGSFPTSILMHLFGLTLPEEAKSFLAALVGKEVQYQVIGRNENGLIEIILYLGETNINELLLEQAGSLIGDKINTPLHQAVIVPAGSASSKPASLAPGSRARVSADFTNVGDIDDGYRYFIGVVLTDRDGTEWVYPGTSQYAANIEPGEVQTMLAIFDVPGYMDKPISYQVMLHRFKPSV